MLRSVDWRLVTDVSGERTFKGQAVQEEYRGADKSLARPERKQDTATEDFDFHISYL